MPYFESNQGVLVNADSDVQVTTLAEAKKIKWGVQTGTTAIDLLDEHRHRPATAASTSSSPTAYTALEAKQVDAFLIDTAINLGEAARSNGKFKVVVAVRAGGWPRPVRRHPAEGLDERRRGQRGVQGAEGLGRARRSSPTKDLTADPGNLPVISTK